MGYCKEFKDLKAIFDVEYEGLSAKEAWKKKHDAIENYLNVVQNRFIENIDRHECNFSAMAADTGYDRTVFVRLYKKLRMGYSVNIKGTQKICYNHFNMSIHEFITGSKDPIPLPNGMNVVAEMLLLLDRPTKESLLQAVQKMWAEQIVQTRDREETTEDIYKERYEEYCRDRYANISAPFGDHYGGLDKVTALNVMGIKPKTDKQAELRLRTMIFLTLANGIPIDYFCVRTYYQYLPLAVRMTVTGDGEEAIITDRLVQRILEYLIASPKGIREPLTAFVLSQHLQRLPGEFRFAV